jgi:hypothetical protein
MKPLLRHLTKIAVFIAMYAIMLYAAINQDARSQVLDSSFYQWKVYEIQENELDYKQCYIVNYPAKSDSDYPARRKPYVMITRFQKDRVEEVSIFSGYEYKLNSRVFAMVDNKQYQLIAKREIAWTRNKYDDIDMISSMLNGSILKVRSDAAIGTYAVDEYSLKGITKAYARMREICR